MSTELTNKTRIVITRLGDYWVTPEQAEVLTRAIENNPTGHIDLEGSIIRANAIDGIIKPEDYEALNMKRRGGWQCKYQKWHERNDHCAHAHARMGL